MMPDIILKNNKWLVVKNAIIYTLRNKDKENAIQKIFSSLKARNINVCGPIIVWDSGIKKDAILEIKRKIILRTNSKPIDLDPNYEYVEDLRFGPCMYARIICSREDIRHAFEKISVHSFENDIELKDESFTVYVDEKSDELTVDVFIPMK